MTTIKNRKYRIEIVCHGSTIDKDADPKHIYRIDMWGFRLLDGDSYRDWTLSRPLSCEHWDDDYTTLDEFNEDQNRRTILRQAWETEILSLLTGQRVTPENMRGYSITNSFAEMFTATKVSRMYDEEASA